MIESKYNLHLQDHTGMVIYNAKSDKIVTLDPQLADIYGKCRNNPDSIREVHPELFSHLQDTGILVENDEDEVRTYIASIEQEANDTQEFRITINPTLACNMKCWYCYENHKNMPAMNTNVKQSTIALINKLASAGTLKKLYLSFFGGEPLLCFDKVVRDIINETVDVCEANDIRLSIHFTTNAFLLTEEILEHLKELDVSFQITIDGNENVHNTVRKTKNDEATYCTIIKNIHLALSKGFSVGVRFNYTAQSIPSFIDVLSDFQNIPSSHKNLLNFTFHRVWQDHAGDLNQIEKQVAEIESTFEKAGLFVNSSNSYSVPYCYADKPNTVVINYNGDLYKCTARDFVSQNREGVLTVDGDIKWNERYKKRLAIKYGSDFCRNCRIYPICHGGCSQHKLESSVIDSCPKGYDEEKIESIIRGRVLFLLGQYKKKQNRKK